MFDLGNHVSSTVMTVISTKNICIKDTIKILVVHFTYNDNRRKKLNFDQILESIDQRDLVTNVEVERS